MVKGEFIMSKELPRTYKSFTEWKEKSKQTEYTEETPLLNPDGTLNAKGWARKNHFTYDRNLVKTGIMSRKEWDFYNIVDDEFQILVSFANINIGGYVAAKLTNLSYVQFLRRFQKYTGVTPSEYITSLRMQKAKTLLSDTDYHIKDIAEKCGFESEYYFSNFFKKNLGLSPKAFRNSLKT